MRLEDVQLKLRVVLCAQAVTAGATGRGAPAGNQQQTVREISLLRVRPLNDGAGNTGGGSSWRQRLQVAAAATSDPPTALPSHLLH